MSPASMRKITALLPIFSSLIHYSLGSSAFSSTRPQSIIVDTDIFSDVDDVGALAIANILHNCGVAVLRGVVINTDSQYGALAASVINEYYGNPDISIAAVRPLTNATFFDTWTYTLGEFATKLSFNFPRSLASTTSTPEPMTLYRTLLASSPTNSSLNLISIGFLNNLAALLVSPPDSISPLTGRELILQKVSKLIIMGGCYPFGWEYNFSGGPWSSTATASILTHWPPSIPVTFSGLEPGASVLSAGHLAERAAPASPILAAYQWYIGRCSTTHKSWDPVTMLYGILGLDDARWAAIGSRPLFRYGNERGRNSLVGADGSNAWVDDAWVTNQHWLELTEGVTNTMVAKVIDVFLEWDPADGCVTELRDLLKTQ